MLPASLRTHASGRFINQQATIGRAGFVTAAATHGAPLARIQDISRHASLDVLVGYIRRANAFEDHPAEAFA